jgi:hypothetical protein
LQNDEKWNFSLFFKVAVPQDDNEYPFRNAWGYCDSLNLFVNSGDKYAKLIKRQKSFYFAGFKGIERKMKYDVLSSSLLGLATDTGRKHSKFIKTIKYYKVEMETGEVY